MSKHSILNVPHNSTSTNLMFSTICHIYWISSYAFFFFTSLDCTGFSIIFPHRKSIWHSCRHAGFVSIPFHRFFTRFHNTRLSSAQWICIYKGSSIVTRTVRNDSYTSRDEEALADRKTREGLLNTNDAELDKKKVSSIYCYCMKCVYWNQINISQNSLFVFSLAF